MPIEHIRLEGDKALIKKLNSFGSDMPLVLEKATLNSVLAVLGQMPDYPVEKPESTYHRRLLLWRTITHLMGRGDMTEFGGGLSRVIGGISKVIGVIGTAIEYGPYTIDKDRQAKQHRGRWWILQDVVWAAKGIIKEYYERSIRESIRRRFR